MTAPTPTERLAYVVVWRNGGTQRYRWTTSTNFYDSAEAFACRASIERGGRKALSFRSDELVRIGLPTGWDAGDTRTVDIRDGWTYPLSEYTATQEG